MAWTTRQWPGVDGDCADGRIAPRHRALGEGWAEQRNDGRARGGSHMQGTAVAADVERGAFDERGELGEIEVTGAHDSGRRSAGEQPRLLGDGFGGRGFGWTRGDDDAAPRVLARQLRGHRGKRGRRPTAKRIAGADVDHDERRAGCHTRGGEPRLHACVHRRIDRHGDRVTRAIRRLDAKRLQQRPLIQHRVTRRNERPRPRHASRVAPAAAGQVIADALRRAGRPREKAAAWSAMEINGDVKTFSAKAGGQLNVVAQSREAARAFEHDDGVEIGMVPDHRLGRCFHQIREAGVGETAPQGADCGRGKDDVSDQAKTNQEDLHGLQGSTVPTFQGRSELWNPGTLELWNHGIKVQSSLRRSTSPGCRP